MSRIIFVSALDIENIEDSKDDFVLDQRSSLNPVDITEVQLYIEDDFFYVVATTNEMIPTEKPPYPEIYFGDLKVMADFESYKARRTDYEGPYAEYKKVDPYHMDVFDHTSMKVEVWKSFERDLWLD